MCILPVLTVMAFFTSDVLRSLNKVRKEVRCIAWIDINLPWTKANNVTNAHTVLMVTRFKELIFKRKALPPVPQISSAKDSIAIPLDEFW